MYIFKLISYAQNHAADEASAHTSMSRRTWSCCTFRCRKAMWSPSTNSNTQPGMRFVVNIAMASVMIRS